MRWSAGGKDIARRAAELCGVALRQYRTNELVRWRMHFLSDAIAEIEGLLEVNRDFCKKQMAEKASPALPTNCAVVPMIFVTSVDCICRCGGTAWVTYPSPLKDGGEVGHGLETTCLSDFFRLRCCRQRQTRMG